MAAICALRPSTASALGGRNPATGQWRKQATEFSTWRLTRSERNRPEPDARRKFEQFLADFQNRCYTYSHRRTKPRFAPRDEENLNARKRPNIHSELAMNTGGGWKAAEIFCLNRS